MHKERILFEIIKRRNNHPFQRSREYLTYVASVGDKQDSIEMRYEDENIWLIQKMMAALYDVDVRTINEHIKKIIQIQNLRKIELSGISG